ncbi:MAG: dihydrolipoyl dehydrogenase [Ideonella sp. MAG2]|nr:MAG: dihydrolipoyl dehydrogenase [Ideonella sp. MAG2]
MATIDVVVPDIGDFKDVGVIEVLVKPGDTVKVEQSLITVESDKASMEIPCSHAGVVKELKVGLGDKVNEGTVVLMLEVAGAAAAAPAPAPAPAAVAAPVVAAPAAAPAPAAAAAGRIEVLVPDIGDFKDVAVIELLVKVGDTVKAEQSLITVESDKASMEIPSSHAGVIKELKVALGDKVNQGTLLAIVEREGAAAAVYHVRVEETTGSGQEKTGASKTIKFKHAIIAAGSQAVHLPFFPKDERIVDSTGALELKAVPKKMLIVGGGIIGLEMGTVYSTLGARLDVVEMMDGLMQGADRDLVKVWEKMNKGRFDKIMLKTKTVGAVATPEGITVQFEGLDGSKSEGTYDLVLQAVGRTPNGGKIGADKAGVAVTDRGFINVDIQMRTNVPHIFAIGDLVGQPMLAHKAVHEAHVAAEVIAGELQGNKELASAAFNARVIPSVAYTDPEVAWVGLTEDQAKAQGIKVKKGLFPWTASGRAIANGRDEGFTKLLFDDSPEAHGHGKILGGGIVGTHAGDMIGEIALAIEMGADAVDIGKTIHPHPTLGESIGMAAEVAHGSCTDLPPSKK